MNEYREKVVFMKLQNIARKCESVNDLTISNSENCFADY